MHVILVVDDDPAYRRLCRTAIENSGFTVCEAEDGAEALRLVGETPVSLVLTDILMPGKDGMETIIELHKTRPTLPIVAMSGGGTVNAEHCLAMARSLGAYAVLRKPFSLGQLLEVIRRALGAAPD